MAFRQFCQRVPTLDALMQTSAGTALRIALTFTSFCMTIMIWRAATLSAGWDMLRTLFVPRGDQITLVTTNVWWCVGLVVLCHVLAQRDLWKRIVDRVPAPVLGFGQGAVVMLVLLLVAGAGRPFVYFQF